MVDSATARSVSGEMMTSHPVSGARSRAFTESADIIDADYMEVEPVPRDAPPASSGQASEAQGHAGMAILDRRARPPMQWARQHGGPLFWLAGCIAIVAAFWISGGHSMFRHARVTAPDLRIAEVRSRSGSVEGSPALLVDGTIENAGGAAGRVPALAVHVVSQDGDTVVYRLGTLRTPLAPGAKYSFSGRLDMPNDGVRTVSVAFDQ
ncbi:MAG: hypothetical protein KDK08_10160 [Rhizobiaceae bacterium]|nr:hypothetical protein [Rhizobiaceae bacterium]